MLMVLRHLLQLEDLIFRHYAKKEVIFVFDELFSFGLLHHLVHKRMEKLLFPAMAFGAVTFKGHPY
jgi:hypothetical protein